jgi:hypothetical protein
VFTIDDLSRIVIDVDAHFLLELVLTIYYSTSPLQNGSISISSGAPAEGIDDGRCKRLQM